MKNTARKTPNQKSNVLSLVNNQKFQTSRANSNLFGMRLNHDVFQFRAGDQIICRKYFGETLSPNAFVVAKTDESEKSLTTVANAVEILSIVVAFKREVCNA